MTIVGSAVVVVRAEVVRFEDDVNQAFQRMQSQAGRFGNSFSRAFGSGASRGLTRFQRESYITYQRINALIERSYYLQAALYQLGAAIGSAVSGLFAFGSQLAATLPSLVVFPSILTAFAQAALTAKLALSGIGKAVQQLNRGAKGADRMPGLLQAYANAQERVANANKRVENAQKALNEAYKTAAERIQQLNFDAEDAAIAQKRAAIALEEARENLKRVQDLPPNSKARREAELAFQEADLNYRRAVDRNKDLQEEQDETTKNGTLNLEQQVEQSDEVVNAQEALNAAIVAQKKAIDEQAKAWKNLNDARTGKGGGSGAPNPLEELSPAAQEFAKFIASLKPEIKKLKEAAGENLFGPLTSAIQNLVDNFLPRLIPILRETGGALGKSAEDFSKFVTQADNLKNFERVAATNVDTVGKFGTVLGNLYSAFLSILAAADPLIRRFTDWLVVLTGGWKESAKLADENGKLAHVFKVSGDAAAQLGDILGNIGSAFMTMGRAAAGPGSGGQMIFDALEKSTEKFKNFTKAMEEDGSLAEYFRKVAVNFNKLGTIIVKIAKIFLKAGDDAGAGSFLDSVAVAVDTLGEAMLGLDETGPAFGKFIENMAKFMASVTEAGSIKIYFGVINKALELLNTLLSNAYVKQIFLYMAAFHGLRAGFNRVGKVILLVGKYITGDFVAIKMFVDKLKFYAFAVKYYWQTSAIGARLSAAATAAWSKVTKIATAVSNALKASFLTNPMFLWIAGIVALVAAIVVMYKKFEWFRNFIHTVWNAIKAAGEGAWKGISKAFEVAWGVLKAIGGAILGFFSKIWDGIKAAWMAIWPAISIALKIAIGLIMIPFMLMIGTMILAWKGVKAAFDLVWPLITGAISFAWNNIIKPIFEAFATVFSGAWNIIKTVVSMVWDEIVQIISFYWNNVIKPIFELYKTVFSAVWDAIQAYISFVWNNVIKPVFEAFGVVFGLVWGGIKAAFTLVWDAIKNAISFYWNNVIKPIFQAFGTIFGAVWSGIKSAFSSAWDFIVTAVEGAKTIFGKVKDAIVTAFKAAINFIIRGWNAIEFKIPGFSVGPVKFGGFTLGLPNIPELATGGVVSRPTLAMIGEGGRPERVEPLDPSGLSRRDRALVAQLSGGGGVTINVHPSPGMDEVELANVVSRQLAFHMRKGVL